MIRRTRTLFELMREISLDDIRDEASRHFSLIVSGPDPGARAVVVEMLSGGVSGPGSPVINHDSAQGWAQSFERASLVAYALHNGQITESDVSLIGRVAPLGVPVILVSMGAKALVGPQAALADMDRLISNSRHRIRVLRLPAEGGQRQLLLAVLQELEAFDLALARQLPAFRSIVVSKLINDTSRANAEFAVMSNIPAVLPVVGNIAAASADLLVLTKNQMLLVFKLAAANGRDVSSSRNVIAEMVPVVGASFFWRSLARELAALLPAVVGTIPKTVIAYTGTYAVGRAAQYYYATGNKPSPELMSAFYKEAMERVKSVISQVESRR